MNGIYCVYEINGEKTEYLLEWLHDKKIRIFGLKKTEKGIILTIDDKDSEKLFAISSNMCYNIKKIRYKGKFAFIKILVEKVGLLVGGLIFVIATMLLDGVITGIDYIGDAEYFKKEIESALASSGIKVFSFAEDAEIEEAEKKILLSSKEVAFVSVKRRGQRLIVEAHRAEREPTIANTKKKEITTPIGGVVGRIVLYGGTALVKTGDEVRAGDVLIDGSYAHGDKTGETYALGEVEIIAEKIFEYEGIGEEKAIKSRAYLLATADIEGEIVSCDYEMKENGGKKICAVKIKYSVWIA